MKEVCHAWGIDTNYTDIDGKKYNGLIGQCDIKRPDDGNIFRLFMKRKQAREYLKGEKSKNYVCNPDARVVRVKIQATWEVQP